MTDLSLCIRNNIRPGILLMLLACFSPLYLRANTAIDSGDYYFQKAEKMFWEAKYDTAYRCYKRSICIPGTTEAYYYRIIRLANLFALQKKLDSVAYYVNEIEKSCPEVKSTHEKIYFEMLHLRARIIHNKGSYREAIDLYNEAIDYGRSYRNFPDTLLSRSFNNLGICYFYLDEYDNAIKNYKSALNLAYKRKYRNNSSAASYLMNIGIIYALKGDYEKSLNYLLKGLDIRKQLLSDDDPDVANTYLNLAQLYSKLSLYEEAIKYNLLAIKLFKRKFGDNYPSLALINRNLGWIYYKKKDHFKAIKYHTYALSIYKENYGDVHPQIGRVHNALGVTYADIGDYSKALFHYKQFLKLAKSKKGKFLAKRNLCGLYNNMDSIVIARKMYKSVIKEIEETVANDPLFVARSYHYYSVFLSADGNYKDALEYGYKALNIHLKYHPSESPFLVELYHTIAFCFLNMEKPDLTLQFLKLSDLSNKPEQNSVFHRRKRAVTDDYLSYYFHMWNILGRAISFYDLYEKENKIDYLDSSQVYFEYAFSEFENVKNTIHENSKLALNSRVKQNFDKYYSVLYRLYLSGYTPKYKEDAFVYSEKRKVSVLLASIRNEDAMLYSSVDEEIQQKERRIKSKINGYENLSLNEKEKTKPDSTKLRLWDRKLLELDKSYDSLIDIMEKKYPKYHALKYKTEVVDLAAVQSFLKEDEALIQYALTDSSLFTFYVNKDTTLFKKQNLDEGFYLNLKTLLSLNAAFGKSGCDSSYKKYVMASTHLYHSLFHGLDTLIKNKRLIIVPDGELGYLSFETLLTAMPDTNSLDYQSLPYLIKQNPLSYSYSSTLLLRSKTKKESSGNQLLALAPNYSLINTFSEEEIAKRGWGELSHLKYTKEEVSKINKLFKGKVLKEEKATEHAFKNAASDYDILHLAMHTKLNDQNPMHSQLIFSKPTDTIDDGLLHTYEIFGMDLKARMAVLSACNTGSGKISHGEGIMSMARGFIYAGVPSIVMTLWEIDDQSSSEIMVNFYHYLDKGYTKDKALQLAKLDYLKTAHPSKLHPYFWAAYVGIGDTQALKIPLLSGKMIYLSVILFIATVVFIYLKNKNRLTRSN